MLLPVMPRHHDYTRILDFEQNGVALVTADDHGYSVSTPVASEGSMARRTGRTSSPDYGLDVHNVYTVIPCLDKSSPHDARRAIGSRNPASTRAP